MIPVRARIEAVALLCCLLLGTLLRNLAPGGVGLAHVLLVLAVPVLGH